MITKTDLIWNFQTVNARVNVPTVGIHGIRQTIGSALTVNARKLNDALKQEGLSRNDKQRMVSNIVAPRMVYGSSLVVS